MAGGSNFCLASRASGISGLDHRTKKCANGVFLFAHAAGVDCVYRRTHEAALAVLWVGLDSLSSCAFGQDNGLHVAGGPVFDLVVAEKTHPLEANFPDHTFPCSRFRHGRISNVVGALPPGDQSCRFYISEPNRAGSCREPGSLVLSKQTHLAIQADIHLPAMGYHADSLSQLRMAVSRTDPMRGNLLSASICRAQRRGRSWLFRCNSESRAGLHHALYVSVHVCGRSLPVSGLYRSYRFGVCRSGQFGRYV